MLNPVYDFSHLEIPNNKMYFQKLKNMTRIKSSNKYMFVKHDGRHWAGCNPSELWKLKECIDEEKKKIKIFTKMKFSL